MILIDIEEYKTLLVNTYFETDSSKDIDILRDLVDSYYTVMYGRQYKNWNLKKVFTENDEEWVLATITSEE